MDPRDKQMLGVLIGTAQEQQTQLDQLLEALGAEIERLGAASTRTGNAATAAQQSAATTAQVAKEVAQYVAKAARDGASTAVGPAVETALADVALAAKTAMTAAATPALDQLASLTKAARSVQEAGAARLETATRRVGWRMFALVASGLLAVWGFAWYGLWIARDETQQLNVQRKALAAEIEGMNATVVQLEQRGGKLVLENCDGRKCIQVSANQGARNIPWGPPYKDSEGVGLVIPKGY